jgi:hypothetical protein
VCDSRQVLDDEEFERLYGPWDAFDPAGVQELLAGFAGPWWVVGGWAIEAFSGVRRRHEDIDVVIFRRDLPLLLDLVRGRYDVWSAGAGMLRPINEEWPDPHPEAGQVWLREHAQAPWVLDCLINEDRDGLWVSRREDAVAPLEEITWVREDGIRFQVPEVVLHHKALQDQPKDRADRDAAWPLMSEDQRAWLREGVLRVYGAEHPWLAWMGSRS